MRSDKEWGKVVKETIPILHQLSDTRHVAASTSRHVNNITTCTVGSTCIYPSPLSDKELSHNLSIWDPRAWQAGRGAESWSGGWPRGLGSQSLL